MAAELKRTLGLDAQLVVGGSGELTVWLDDKLVAEKKFGRFPSPEDVVVAMKSLLSAST